MLKTITHIIAGLCILISSTTYAQWFETEGSAQIHNGDVAQAKAQAIEEALRQAMLDSGAFISTEQSSYDGVLNNDTFNISANNDIRQYSLLSEKRDKNYFYVKVRVFIENETQNCLGSRYKKNVLPVLFKYDREQYQLSALGLNDINVAISNRLEKIIKDNRLMIPRAVYNKNLGIDPINLNPNDTSLKNTIQELARVNDVQYIITGVIRDLNIHKEDEGLINSLVGDDIRDMGFSIYVFDGISGEEVYRNDYTTSAVWEFGSKKNDVMSDYFWHSAYGLATNSLLKRTVDDINQALACSKPIARIVKKDPYSDNFFINLGKVNNIKQGNRFYIEHDARFTDINGRERYVRQRAKTQAEVIEVYSNTAILKPIEHANGNIQINDLCYIE